MACLDCSSDLRTAGPYCAACGARLSAHRRGSGDLAPLNRDTAPVLELRPRYHRSLVLRAQLPIAVFLVAWGTLAVGGATSVLGEALGWQVRTASLLGGFALVLAASLPAGGLLLGRRACRRARLRLHPDRLIVRDGLFAFRERALRYGDLERVEVRRSAAQARVGLSSLLLHTHAAIPIVGHLVRIDDVEHAERAEDCVRRMMAPPVGLDAPTRLDRAA